MKIPTPLYPGKYETIKYIESTVLLYKQLVILTSGEFHKTLTLHFFTGYWRHSKYVSRIYNKSTIFFIFRLNRMKFGLFKGIYCRFTRGRPETTKLSPFNATNFN